MTQYQHARSVTRDRRDALLKFSFHRQLRRLIK
jgi:hypothetical protein